MLGKQILSWMYEHERTLGYLCRKAGLTIDGLIALITGAVAQTNTVLAALGGATDLSEDQLQTSAADLAASERKANPVSCLTVKTEIDASTLGSITLGEPVKRLLERGDRTEAGKVAQRRWRGSGLT